MIKKSTRVLVLLAVMLTVFAVVALALAAFGSPENNPPEKENVSTENSNNTTAVNKTNDVKITPAEAQQIAEKFIEESGATTGVPTLDKIDGEMVYTVPVVMNGTKVGEININAMTGENMGGAGGAP